MKPRKLFTLLLAFGALLLAQSVYASSEEYTNDDPDDNGSYEDDGVGTLPPFNVDGDDPATFEREGYEELCERMGLGDPPYPEDFDSYADFWDWVRDYYNTHMGDDTSSSDDIPNTDGGDGADPNGPGLITPGGSAPNPGTNTNNDDVITPPPPSAHLINGITGKAVTHNGNEQGVNLNLYNSSQNQYAESNSTAFNGNYYAIGSHGDATSIILPDGSPMTATQLANELRTNSALNWHEGDNIWLIGCATGADNPNGGDNFAQQLANILGVDVVAPNTLTWTSRLDGSVIVAYPDPNDPSQPDPNNRGQWIIFKRKP
jgi:hypothetical protein